MFSSNYCFTSKSSTTSGAEIGRIVSRSISNNTVNSKSTKSINLDQIETTLIGASKGKIVTEKERLYMVYTL